MSHPVDCPVAGLDQYGAQRPGFEFGEQFVDAQAEHKRCWLGIARRWRYLVIDQHAKARTGSQDLVRQPLLDAARGRIASRP